MSAAPVPNWRQLAEAASRESDPAKLLEIVGQLCRSLDKVHTNEQATEPEPPQDEALQTDVLPEGCMLPTRTTELRDTNNKLIVSVG